jgi:hypothetical protein
MLYAILCYNSEEIVSSWTKEEDDAVMARLAVVHDKLTAQGKLGPAARLKGTRNATTIRKSGQGRRLEPGREPPMVIDGPYAETKEQMLGFYVLDCTDQEEAVDIARQLAQANPGGVYELRPISLFLPGGPLGG